jgi:hypothetical protein
MPYSKPSDVPANVPEGKKAQFMEVWNSAYKAAKKAGMSDADAEKKAFKEAWGVIGRSMANNKMEYRVFKTELRADATSPMAEGYAAVFNTRTDLGSFQEQIAPGAFKRALGEGQDVRMLFNHDPNMVLGRTKSGTLRLSEDNTGLRCQNDMPDTQLGRDVYTLMKRGDVSQMSFGFIVRAEDIEFNADGSALRTITDVDMFDVSIVTYPAYESTSVEARSVEEVRAALKSKRDAGETTLPDAGDEGTVHDCQCGCEQCKAGNCPECSNGACTGMAMNCDHTVRMSVFKAKTRLAEIE